MHNIYKLSILFLLALSSQVSYAKSKHTPLRTFGDITQVANPMIAAMIASQDKGVGHFGIIYAQQFVIMQGAKLAGKSGKWHAGKRPFVAGKRSRYDGMPSGHTVSSWSAASYIRTFHENPYLSIPFYVTASVAAYSRVKCKEHTVGQVVAGAALSEIVTFVNSKMSWSQDYVSTSVDIGQKSGALSFSLKL